MQNSRNPFNWLLRRFAGRPRLGTARANLQAPAPLIADFFDAPWYEASNADVARSGLDPWTHYLDVGVREGRPPCPNLDVGGSPVPLAVPREMARDRRAFLRRHIDRSSKVLEIGAAFNPILPKSEGFGVYTVDNGDREELRRRYDGFREIDIDRIEEVDFVWKDGDILGAIPPEHRGSFDVVLMGGAIEHIPNPIGLLRSLQKLLKPGGYLSVSVPDKRFCFDFMRPLTTTAAWLEAFLRGDVRHSARTLFEYKTMAVARRGRLIWVEKDLDVRDATFVGLTPQLAYAEFFASQGDAYVDAHAWVFTPSSFTLVVNECHELGLLSLVPESVSLGFEAEFLSHLRLAYRRPITHHERLQLLASSAREQAEGFSWAQPAREGRVWSRPGWLAGLGRR